jgi:hypothetical protein
LLCLLLLFFFFKKISFIYLFINIFIVFFIKMDTYRYLIGADVTLSWRLMESVKKFIEI